jgi:hypothetical protein
MFGILFVMCVVLKLVAFITLNSTIRNADIEFLCLLSSLLFLSNTMHVLNLISTR